eukprot:361074-Chlamydomonas_euryale.AAC.1
MLTHEVLEVVCALLTHRRFAELFVEAGGAGALLALPRDLHTFSGLSQVWSSSRPGRRSGLGTGWLDSLLGMVSVPGFDSVSCMGGWEMGWLASLRQGKAVGVLQPSSLAFCPAVRFFLAPWALKRNPQTG